MEPLDYGVEPSKRRVPRWFKVSGGVLVLMVVLGIIALGGIVLVLWFCLWLVEKIAPML